MSTNASFLPEDYLARKLARRSNIVCVTLFAVVLTGVLGAYFVKLRQKQVAAKGLLEANLQVEAEAAKIEQATQLQKQHQEMLMKASITSALIDPVNKSNVLAELVNHMPASLSLTELDLQTKVEKKNARPKSSLQKDKLREEAAKAPKIEIPDTTVTITMTGVAPTDVEVSDYMSALGAHPLFTDVNLSYAEAYVVNEAEMRRFQVELRLAKDVTMAELEPTRRNRDIDGNPMSETLEITPEGIKTR